MCVKTLDFHNAFLWSHIAVALGTHVYRRCKHLPFFMMKFPKVNIHIQPQEVDCETMSSCFDGNSESEFHSVQPCFFLVGCICWFQLRTQRNNVTNQKTMKHSRRESSECRYSKFIHAMFLQNGNRKCALVCGRDIATSQHTNGNAEQTCFFTIEQKTNRTEYEVIHLLFSKHKHQQRVLYVCEFLWFQDKQKKVKQNKNIQKVVS